MAPREVSAAGLTIDAALAAPGSRLARIDLAGEALTRLSPVLEADRAQAAADLAVDSRFFPNGGEGNGPFALELSIQDGRLVFAVFAHDSNPLKTVVLALGPFRSLIRDYRLLVESHVTAVAEGREVRIQAIDMGRRGLHNEGAELLIQRLAGKIAIDFPTARRLFTLVCILHQRA